MMMQPGLRPEVLITSIRESFIGSEQVFTQGSCVMFFRILKTVFPDAVPYWSEKSKHMITQIGRHFYDIRGRVRRASHYKADTSETYTSLPIAVAFPQEEGRRFSLLSPSTIPDSIR